ncbi:Zn-dependent protease [hydrothermal vent metagenome]|uniref:Zn-dependent protease n=1 Tax=hydrothermal vent metagenome TaxID=652676 RepID=A0A3B0Z122_9ZZZZ
MNDWTKNKDKENTKPAQMNEAVHQKDSQSLLSAESSGSHTERDKRQVAAEVPAVSKAPARSHWLMIGGLVFKLFKSVKVLKIALVGTAFAGWGLIFNWQFAAVLIIVIMFHEYGHVQAMKKFGIPTKGFYLIPFVGGVAIGDKAKSEWQELYISMMGPVYGLLMTVTFFVAYLMSGNNFVGLVASISALINVFNLFPIYPLDGGHVVKSMVFSGKKYWGILFLLLGSALGFVISLKFGLYFICFFIVLGVLDLLFSWKELHHEEKISMDKYGIMFSFIWYIATVITFIGIILIMASSRVPGTEIARIILSS